jgi:GntR family transcriptional regulator, transcriptional repressor for pyruvate dehydrogenase complex
MAGPDVTWASWGGLIGVGPDLALTRVEKRRTWQAVVDQLEAQILEGRLRAGDRLPGERQLAERLGVSRASVREALRVLEALEFVRARTGTGQGSGSVIVTEPTAGGAVTNLLRLHLGLSHFTMEEVVEVRVLLETWTTRMAARQADEEDLNRLQDLVHRMESPALSLWEFNELDTDFHVAMAEISGNRLLTYLMHAIRDAVRLTMLAALEDVDDWREAVQGPKREHGAVLNAVSARDEDAAARAVENHIRAFYRHRIVAALGPETAPSAEASGLT